MPYSIALFLVAVLSSCTLALDPSSFTGGSDSGTDVPSDSVGSDGAIPGAPRPLGPNDVSVLFPISDANNLMSASTLGLGGALLPRNIFDQIPEDLTNEIVGGDATYSALRVVSFRFDPCFTVTLESACQPQLRVVFQPIVLDRGLHAADGAIHLMYNLNVDQAGAALSALRSAATLAPENVDATLRTNPALVQQGLLGSYGTALRTLITTLAGPDNLARMTFITRTRARQPTWHFGGFAIQAFVETGFGAPGPITIPLIDQRLQTLSNAPPQPGSPINMLLTPEFGEEAGRIGTSGSAIAALNASDPRLLALRQWYARVEGPTAHTPDTVDCASCHVAGHIRRAVIQQHGADPADTIESPGAVAQSPADRVLDNTRAFGYFNTDPAISQRTANETAAIVFALSND